MNNQYDNEDNTIIEATKTSRVYTCIEVEE